MLRIIREIHFTCFCISHRSLNRKIRLNVRHLFNLRFCLRCFSTFKRRFAELYIVIYIINRTNSIHVYIKTQRSEKLPKCLIKIKKEATFLAASKLLIVNSCIFHSLNTFFNCVNVFCKSDSKISFTVLAIAVSRRNNNVSFFKHNSYKFF